MSTWRILIVDLGVARQHGHVRSAVDPAEALDRLLRPRNHHLEHVQEALDRLELRASPSAPVSPKNSLPRLTICIGLTVHRQSVTRHRPQLVIPG